MPRAATPSADPTRNLLMTGSPSARPPGFNALAGQVLPNVSAAPSGNMLASGSIPGMPPPELNKRFPGAAPQVEAPAMAVQGGVMAPAGHMAQAGAPNASMPPASTGGSPMDALASIVAGRQFTPQEMLQHERSLTAAINAIDALLRFRPITQADINDAEKQARSSGKHPPGLIDEFLRKLPPADNQNRLRATLQSEKQVAVRSLAALHMAADKRRLNFSGLVRSGKVGRAR